MKNQFIKTRKLLSTLAALAVTLSMVSCGSDDNNANSRYTNSATTTTTTKPTATTTTTTKSIPKKFDNFIFNESVPNDVTGNWKSVIVDEKFDVVKNAIDLYNCYFSNEQTILAVINLENQTTACISKVLGALDITIHKYVDGGENDAKSMFCGKVLSEYWVYIDSGKSEKIR